MRIKSDYILREVAGNYVVVPVGKAAVNFNGMMTLNETGAFIWKELSVEISEEQLLAALLGKYDIDEATAKADISCFFEKLKAADVFE
ncbi:MAG TPA: PqqD family protein [Clostridiales bacterium]|nr:PqqD family protein [Clostridiales bacterium]